MTIEELIEALSNYPADAQIKCGISIPSLYINTVANMSVSGNHVEPQKCDAVRIILAAPSARPPETKDAVQSD
jgi:hypothetical protein